LIEEFWLHTPVDRPWGLRTQG